MKSYIIRNEDRKRVEQYAKRQTEIMQQTYINLVLKLMAVVMVVGFICVIISNHVKRRKKRK